MSLNVFQQVFSLSLASNLVSDLKGTEESLQRALQRGLTLALPPIGDWSVVWGPRVWKYKPNDATTGPENSWFVAYHPCLQFEDGSVHPTYVIAIAGTPPESEYAWARENFAVNSVANFNLWVANGIQNHPEVVRARDVVPGTPYIATGTVNAVHLLLTKPAPAGAAGAGTTILDFLCNVDMSDDTRVISTGYSLGGGLSPSLALALVASGVIPASETLTYPIAGASPGNVTLTELFASTFPAYKASGGSSYMGWNLNLVNTLDIVPQAWCPIKAYSPAQNLGNIPPIYGEPVVRLVQGIAVVFTLHALSSGTVYKPLPSQCFTGPPPPAAPKSLEEFLKVAGPQHIKCYLDEVGVPMPDRSQVLDAGLTEKAEQEKLFNYPVIAELEWALEHPEEAKKAIENLEGSEVEA